MAIQEDAVQQDQSVDDANRVEQAYSERVRHLRVVVRWCDRAADLVAWRIRCASEGRVLEWSAELRKGRAVLRRLEAFGLVAPALTSGLLDVVELPGASPEGRPAGSFGSEAESAAMVLSMAMLERCFADLVPPEAPGVKGSKAAGVRASVGRGFLRAVAVLAVDDALARLMDRVAGKVIVDGADAALLKRAETAKDSDRLRGVSLADDGDDRDDPVTGLAVAKEAVEKAKADLLKARAAVRRNTTRLQVRRKAARKKVRTAAAAGPGLFDTP